MYSLFLYTTMEQIDIHTGNIKNRNPISTRGVSEGTPLENLVFTARFLCFFHIDSKNQPNQDVNTGNTFYLACYLHCLRLCQQNYNFFSKGSDNHLNTLVLIRTLHYSKAQFLSQISGILCQFPLMFDRTILITQNFYENCLNFHISEPPL